MLSGAAPDTSFGRNAMALLTAKGGFPWAYSDFANGVISTMRTPGAAQTLPSDVVEAVWRAATDPSAPSLPAP